MLLTLQLLNIVMVMVMVLVMVMVMVMLLVMGVIGVGLLGSDLDVMPSGRLFIIFAIS